MVKENWRLGVVLSAAGAAVGLVAFYLFVQIYNPMIAVELAAGRPDEGIVVRYVFPLLGWLAIGAGVLWGLALYGFLTRGRWAWTLGLIASTVSLLAGWFPMMPALSRGVSPVTAAVFVPNMALWLGLLWMRRIDRRLGLLAFAAGLAYVLSFMCGVASFNKIQVTGSQPTLNGMFVMVQQINWWGAAAWGVFIVALLTGRPWARIVGLGAGLLACYGGYPVGIATMLEKGRFSLFMPSPLLSTVLIVILLLPATRKWLEGSQAAQ
jgi:hypothetical protein